MQVKLSMKGSTKWGLVCNSKKAVNLAGRETAGPTEAKAICQKLGFAFARPSVRCHAVERGNVLDREGPYAVLPPEPFIPAVGNFSFVASQIR